MRTRRAAAHLRRHLRRRSWAWRVRAFRCFWMRRASDLAVALHPDHVYVVMEPRWCPSCGLRR